MGLRDRAPVVCRRWPPAGRHIDLHARTQFLDHRRGAVVGCQLRLQRQTGRPGKERLFVLGRQC